MIDGRKRMPNSADSLEAGPADGKGYAQTIDSELKRN